MRGRVTSTAARAIEEMIPRIAGRERTPLTTVLTFLSGEMGAHKRERILEREQLLGQIPCRAPGPKLLHQFALPGDAC